MLRNTSGHLRRLRALVAIAASVAIAACASGGRPDPNAWPGMLYMEFSRQPDTAPIRWLGLIGEYGADTTMRW
ncbi:MAG: hypothetical protein ACREBP_05580, partial [Sphingomicrobium sp.]